MIKPILFLTLFCALAFSACNTKENNNAASTTSVPDSVYNKLSPEEKRSPANALAGLDVAEGLQVTLFASDTCGAVGSTNFTLGIDADRLLVDGFE